MTTHHMTLELNIIGMDCPNYAGHFEGVVKGIDGVTKVTTLLADRKAVVLFDPAKTTSASVREYIETAGYSIIVEGYEKALEAESAEQPMQPTAQVGRQDKLHIENMDCPTEEALVRNKFF